MFRNHLHGLKSILRRTVLFSLTNPSFDFLLCNLFISLQSSIRRIEWVAFIHFEHQHHQHRHHFNLILSVCCSNFVNISIYIYNGTDALVHVPTSIGASFVPFRIHSSIICSFVANFQSIMNKQVHKRVFSSNWWIRST